MHTLCRAALTTGATVGWAGALGGVLLPATLPHERMALAMMLLLSVALICSACLVTRRYQRPLGDAYELGYSRGRRDAILEANRSGSASNLRRVSG